LIKFVFSLTLITYSYSPNIINQQIKLNQNSNQPALQQQKPTQFSTLAMNSASRVAWFTESQIDDMQGLEEVNVPVKPILVVGYKYDPKSTIGPAWSSKIQRTAPDRNSNLLVIAVSTKIAHDLTVDKVFLGEYKKINFNDPLNNPTAFVRNLNFESAVANKEQLIGLGVIGVIALDSNKDSTTHISPSCKLVFETSNKRDTLISSGLKVNGSIHNVEHAIKVAQCSACKQLGHGSNFCKNEQACSRCGGKHTEAESMCSLDPKCVNCGGKHTSFNRICGAFKLAKLDKKAKIVSQVSSRLSSAATEKVHQNYSSAGSSDPQQNTMFSKLMKMMENLTTKFDHAESQREADKADIVDSLQKTFIEQAENQQKYTNKAVLDNNDKLSECLTNILLTVSGSTDRTSMSTVVNKQFIEHGLKQAKPPQSQLDSVDILAKAQASVLNEIQNANPTLQQQTGTKTSAATVRELLNQQKAQQTHQGSPFNHLISSGPVINTNTFYSQNKPFINPSVFTTATNSTNNQ
jgi:hypothetical protein